MGKHLTGARRLRTVLGLSAVSLAVVGSMAFADVAGATPTITTVPTGTNHIIVGSGSSTTYPMMVQLDALYNQALGCTTTVDITSATAPQPFDFSCLDQTTITNGQNIGAVLPSPTTTPNPFNDAAVEMTPIGSSNGLIQLASAGGSLTELSTKYSYYGAANIPTNINFVRSSRAEGDTKDVKGLNFVAYAADGVDWVHYSTYAGAPTNSDIGGKISGSIMTQAQIQGIYNGKIARWGKVGAGLAPVIVFSAQTGSGTQDTYKGFLGTDPSTPTARVNCFNTTGIVFNSIPATAANCAGPIDIFENETGQITLNSVPNKLKDPTAVDGFAASSATVTNTATQSTQPAAGSIAAPASCGTWWLGCTTTGAIVKTGGSGASTVWTQTWTLSSLTSQMLINDAIFFYSAGLFNHQCSLTTGVVYGSITSINNPTRCATGNFTDYAKGPGGGVTFQLGQTGGTTPAAGPAVYSSFLTAAVVNADGSVSLGSCAASATLIPAPAGYIPCLPTQKSILDGDFTSKRLVYNVYSNGSQASVPAATGATLNYVSETGFICSTQHGAIVNPQDGHTYRQDLQSVIFSSGFFPLSAGRTTGTINQVAFDEGGVGHPSTSVTLTGTDTRYTPYITPASTAGNGDPNGFCLVTTSDNGLTP